MSVNFTPVIKFRRSIQAFVFLLLQVKSTHAILQRQINKIFDGTNSPGKYLHGMLNERAYSHPNIHRIS